MGSSGYLIVLSTVIDRCAPFIMAPASKPRVLLIGGQFTGNFCARDLKKHGHVTVVDAKEYFEYTPGVLRAYVKPCHLDSLTFTLQPVLERSVGVKFIWGEVKALDGDKKTATIKPIFSQHTDEIAWDYCIICAGCNFGPFKPMGESLWFPTIHEEARKVSDWPHIDERFIEGRRRHVLQEFHKLHDLNKKKASILVVGAGFIGVEWATEIEHFFPDVQLTIIDFLPRCLGPLPDSAAAYCSKCVLSDKGPGGGGWIHFNKFMQVVKKPTEGGGLWADGKVFAVGDCNLGCIGEPPNFEMPPVPKISYPGEEQALHACVNLERIHKNKSLKPTWWPWGAGMFATSLGPHDACFVLAANENKGSGYMVNWWIPAALQKEIIETSKIDECRNGLTGILIWHFVHHTPVHLFGKGPWIP